MKKGYLRTLEAVIAIILIFLFMYAITPKQTPEVKVPESISLTQKAILSGMQQNESLRNFISTGYSSSISPTDYTTLINFIKINLPFGFDHNMTICDYTGASCVCEDLNSMTTNSCVSPNSPGLPDKTVYARSILITTPSTKIVRLYLWQK